MNGSFKSINFLRNNTLMRWDYIPVASVSKQLTCIWVFYSIDLLYISQVVRTTTLRWELYVNGIKDERSLYSKTSGAIGITL